MTRNVSAVVDDEIYDFIEEIRKEQGVLKSKSINNLLKEMMNKRKSQNISKSSIQPQAQAQLPSSQSQQLVSEQTSQTSIPQSLQVSNPTSSPQSPNPLQTSISIDTKSSTIQSSPTGLSPSNPIILQDKSDIKTAAVNNDVKTDAVKQDSKSATKQPTKPINRYANYPMTPRFGFRFGQKTKQTEVKRMTTHEEEEPQVSDRERYKRYREEEENERKMKDLYERVKNTHLRVCEDGDCFRKELSGIKKDVEEIKESRKVDQELVEVRKGLDDLKKNVTRMEVCPECGEKSIVHMSSFCSNCGSKVNEWTDDTGSKITSWKPYWERVRTHQGQ